MAIHSIHRRWKTEPFALVEAESLPRALEIAARNGADLTCADLRGLVAPGCFLPAVDLRGVDLSGAEVVGGYLRGSDLRGSALVEANLATASLRQADLRKADLRNADLRMTDLRDAQFVGADLRGVRLTGARLEGALIDWRWAAFPVELLRSAADCRDGSFRVVAELAFIDDDRPYDWFRALIKKPRPLDWAFRALGRAVFKGDDAPEMLRLLTADALADPEADAESAHSNRGRLYWTRRASR